VSKKIKNVCIISSLIVAFFLSGFGTACAKFTCEVKSIQGKQLILDNCQEKGLKRLKPGDKVGITKKRKSKKVEGC